MDLLKTDNSCYKVHKWLNTLYILTQLLLFQVLKSVLSFSLIPHACTSDEGLCAKHSICCNLQGILNFSFETLVITLSL